MKYSSFKVSALSAAVIMTLAGCGGSSNKNETEQVVDVAPTAQNVSIADAKHWVPVNASLNANDTNGDTLSFSFQENGKAVDAVDNNTYHFSHGTLVLNGQTFTYTSLTGEDASIDYTVTANGKTASAKINITNVQSDPLANQQWHLRNTGQKAFALSKEMLTAVAPFNGFNTEEEINTFVELVNENFNKNLTLVGADMNVAEAYQHSVTGAGVTAVVVDSGLEIRHEDLDDNVIPNRSLNFDPSAFDQTDPTKSVPEDGVYHLPRDYSDHGTAVAGLIASEGWNNMGGRGVAPNTSLIGMNYIYKNTNQTDWKVQAMVHGMAGSGIQAHEEVVFNRSYGYNPALFIPDNNHEQLMTAYTSNVLRNGKGAISVKASGNDFIRGRAQDGNFCDAAGTNALGLGCIDMNVSASNRSLDHITVGALKANGKRASYSTSGSGIFVSAPAGENGTWEPAMITTDNMTCLDGESGYPLMQNYLNNGDSLDILKSLLHFNYPGHPLNSSCNYRNNMNGTSSAAPNTSGVVALVMEANPSLTARDIKHILATTATKTDPDNSQIVRKTGDGDFKAHLGWVENKAGYNFNNFYGFGRVNAGKAVKIAKSFVSLPEQSQSKWVFVGKETDVAPTAPGVSQLTEKGDSLALTIPNNSAKGVSHTITLEDNYTIEAMQFTFNISNAETRGYLSTADVPGTIQSSAGTDLALEVTSPSGTKAIILASGHANLLPAISKDRNSFIDGYIHTPSVSFLSHAFYGENSKGQWKIKAVDTANSQSVNFTNGNGQVSVVFPNTAESVLEGWGVRVTGHKG